MFLFCFSSSCVPLAVEPEVVNHMLPVSFDWPFWIAPSVFSNFYSLDNGKRTKL